jgi:hypothetical protein
MSTMSFDYIGQWVRITYGPHAGKGPRYGARLVPRPNPKAEARRAQKARSTR